MKTKSLGKAYEITDAKIQFVSLVDRAANGREFLITKQEGGKASFTSCGRIVKADAENHYVTGIVYEPMVEDVHGNFMTEDEITKAAYWFAKNGDKVDLQHSFEPLADAAVVENWVAKADSEIEGQPIKKGTWLMTVEVTDPAIWDGIEGGEITGFSMGGLGNFSEEDTDLSNVEKTQENGERSGLLKQIADALGLNVVEKGKVTEVYQKRTKANMFWEAWEALNQVLERRDIDGNVSFENDEETIKEALTEFNDIITAILTSKEPIAKALYLAKPASIEKAGKELSNRNKETLQNIYDDLGAFLDAVGETSDTLAEENDDKKDRADAEEKESAESEEDTDEDEEDEKKSIKKGGEEMTRAECENLITDTIKKAVAETDGRELEKSADNKITAEEVKKMVDEAVMEFANSAGKDFVTPAQVQEMVVKAVSKAVEPLFKSHGLSTNLNDAVKKDAGKEHYLHGIL